MEGKKRAFIPVYCILLLLLLFFKTGPCFFILYRGPMNSVASHAVISLISKIRKAEPLLVLYGDSVKMRKTSSLGRPIITHHFSMALQTGCVYVRHKTYNHLSAMTLRKIGDKTYPR